MGNTNPANRMDAGSQPDVRAGSEPESAFQTFSAASTAIDLMKDGGAIRGTGENWRARRPASSVPGIPEAVWKVRPTGQIAIEMVIRERPLRIASGIQREVAWRAVQAATASDFGAGGMT